MSTSFLSQSPRTLFGSFSLLAVLALVLTACSKEPSATTERTSDFSYQGIEIQDAWARPGAEGGMSAAYFRISNGAGEADTLRSAQSEVAMLTEVHESFQQQGMMGMREVPFVEIPARSSVVFQQGGLHVMLIRLKEGLAEGDSVALTLTFSHSEPVTVQVPVRMATRR